MFDNMNKIHSLMLDFFSNINVDSTKSMYKNYISFTNNPVNKKTFENITKYDDNVFESLFLYKVYGIFEIKYPLQIILKLKKLNIDYLAYLTFEEYLMITTMYKNYDYLDKLYKFYILTFTSTNVYIRNNLLDILKNIKNIEQIPNFVHPYNYVFMMADPENNIFDINSLIQVCEFIDTHYENRWSRAYSLIKCTTEIREVKNVITKVDNEHWLMKNEGIFFPTTDKTLFFEYNNKRKCKFGGHSFEYLLDDLQIPDTFSLYEIVIGIKKIFDEKTKQKYIDLINFLRVVKNYKDTEFLFSDTNSSSKTDISNMTSLTVNKNQIKIIPFSKNQNKTNYLISPCPSIKGTYYMEF